MVDKNNNKLKNGDIVCVFPSYEESEGGQVYKIWHGSIKIINDVYYLDDEILTHDECKRIAIHNVKNYHLGKS